MHGIPVVVVVVVVPNRAVRSCISVTTSLKELRIEGIALSQKDTACIAKVWLLSTA